MPLLGNTSFQVPKWDHFIYLLVCLNLDCCSRTSHEMKSHTVYTFVCPSFAQHHVCDIYPVVHWSQLKPECGSQLCASFSNSAFRGCKLKWEYCSRNIYIMEIDKHYKSRLSLPHRADCQHISGFVHVVGQINSAALCIAE